MKKLINGRRYDTDGAKEVGSDSYGNYGGLFRWEETLYQKRTGEFFLHGSGGPGSKYARSLGQNEWSGGEELIPLSYEAARKWAEEHLDADEYEKYFDVEEGTKRTVTLSLTEATIAKIARLAVENNCSKSEVVERMFE